ncbi:hypothetical protein ACIHFD_60550 [Nonomuraea sp. NPDC051941]
MGRTLVDISPPPAGYGVGVESPLSLAGQRLISWNGATTSGGED